MKHSKKNRCFAKDNIKSVLFGVFEQTVKFWSAAVRAGIVVVAVNVVKFPPLFHSILQQHRFLILYAVAVVGFKLLVSIFFG